jgi:hypothetical protein
MAIAALAAPQAIAAETASQPSLDRLADTLGYQLTMVDNPPSLPGRDRRLLPVVDDAPRFDFRGLHVDVAATSTPRPRSWRSSTRWRPTS